MEPNYRTKDFHVSGFSDGYYAAQLIYGGGPALERKFFKFLLKGLSHGTSDSIRDDRLHMKQLLVKIVKRWPTALRPFEKPSGYARERIENAFHSKVPVSIVYVSAWSNLIASSFHAQIYSVHKWGFKVELEQGVRSYSWTGLYSVDESFPFEANVGIHFPSSSSGSKTGSLTMLR